MKTWKRVPALCLALCLLLSVAIPARAAGYVYQVTVSGGAHGTVNGAASVTVEVPYGTVWYPDQDNFQIEVTDEKYYFKGFHLSGQDALVGSTKITEDVTFVASYGIRGDTVQYTVTYRDTAGNVLHPDRTAYGNVGDKPVVPAVYVEGWQATAESGGVRIATYSLTKTLSENEAENVFRFIYYPVEPEQPAVSQEPEQPAASQEPESPATAQPENEDTSDDPQTETETETTPQTSASGTETTPATASAAPAANTPAATNAPAANAPAPTNAPAAANVPAANAPAADAAPAANAPAAGAEAGTETDTAEPEAEPAPAEETGTDNEEIPANAPEPETIADDAPPLALEDPEPVIDLDDAQVPLAAGDGFSAQESEEQEPESEPEARTFPAAALAGGIGGLLILLILLAALLRRRRR